MPRKTAIIGAAFLTGVITLSLFILGRSGGAGATALPAVQAATTLDESSTVSSTTDFEAELARRETAMLDQLALREAAIAEMDASYAPQLAALEERLAATNASLMEKSAHIETLQTDAQGKADEIAAVDQAFQAELARLQGGLSYEDAQMRAQIEAVYAQLQQAYDQLAAAQVASGGGGGGSSAVTSPPPAASGDHDDHDDDDHDDDHDEHDDDHEDEDDDGD